MVVSFDTRVEEAAEMADDPEKLAGVIRELRVGGGTSLYDAIYIACRAGSRRTNLDTSLGGR